MICDFYQMPLVQDSWIFSPKNIGFNILAINFWHENVKCYELHFINIVNRFQIASQTNEYIHFMNNFLFKTTTDG
jgi:hypothetical protein